ncbi:MAG: sigma-54-dependent transcriptional regulator [Burkholderiales bacterium]
MKPLPVLVVEDDAALREALRDTLELSGYSVLAAKHGNEAMDVLSDHHVGIVVTDVQMRPMDGHALLSAIKRDHPATPVLLMTAYGMIDKAVDAMRAGACNYLTKPFEPQDLVAEVARWMLPSGANGDAEFITHDPATAALLELAKRVAASGATVLITGESGTGKEVLARYVHRLSPRAAKPFIAINCAAIPENLLEATLFGHEKGAFTGASQSHIGKFEQAQGGTLLLDEISEMPLPLQSKLLRVLQEREVERVGGKHAIALDVRVLATSNRSMEKEVAEGRFREDLYYRLNVFPLHLKPLRERPADIVPLARRLLARHGAGKPLGLSDGAAMALTAYGWRGNIRELENVIQRAVILAPGGVIEPEHLYLPLAAPAQERERNPAEGVGRDLKSLEREHIMETLAQVKGVRKAAAERLGMSERTLRHKLQRYREEDGGGAAGGLGVGD